MAEQSMHGDWQQQQESYDADAHYYTTIQWLRAFQLSLVQDLYEALHNDKITHTSLYTTAHK